MTNFSTLQRTDCFKDVSNQSLNCTGANYKMFNNRNQAQT